MIEELRSLPSVDRVLNDARVRKAGEAFPHETVVGVIRRVLEEKRLVMRAEGKAIAPDDVIAAVVSELEGLAELSLRRVVNATGVILHTNLGRAPLSEDAIAVMREVSSGYCNLEFDLEAGSRGSRESHVEALLCELTGAEAAAVVNNNAAAVLLGLTALARRREVVVSRGQAVEIGGGFRIPDVMRQSGAKLVEVGTTNRTYAHDYEEAITERTVALMRVHSSNFRIIGFTSGVTLEELVAIARRHDLLVLDDLGSGCLLDTTVYGLSPEPMVQQSVRGGASLVFFSGDKLLGGPQAGIIVGQKQCVEKLRRHPMMRALRMDKVRLAALAVTLGHYLRGEAVARVPVWRMIAAPLSVLEERVRKWLEACDGAEVVEGETMVGGGSIPGSGLPTRLLAIAGRGGNSPQALARLLRARKVPVVGRVEKDRLLLDSRTVLPEEDGIVLEALCDISRRLKRG
ncbi:MAG: L-seryl-tRNA(Sec) selenium transferase [Dehalococcoidales bacterium]|nr:L-seryl-tRNA(Sec) selenium transferase [Dehalococcoidales bacterium]